MNKKEKLNLAISKLDQAINGRLMRDGVNYCEGGLRSYPDIKKIKEDVEEALLLLKDNTDD